jgi:hypothetical protein
MIMTEEIDRLLRGAMPVPPAHLAGRVLARVDRRRMMRMRAVMTGAALLVAAAALAIVLLPERDPTPANVALDHPAVAPVHAPPPPAPPPPAPPPSGWQDLPSLVAKLARDVGPAIDHCAKGRGHAGIRVDRKPDGTAEASYMIEHSLGIHGYSELDRCMMAAVATVKLPVMPEHLERIDLYIGGEVPAMDDMLSAWRDPVEVMNRSVTGLDACFPTGKHYRVRIVVRSRHDGTVALLGEPPFQPADKAIDAKCVHRILAHTSLPEFPLYSVEFVFDVVGR